MKCEMPEICCCFSVPDNPPVNTSVVLNGTEVLVAWEQPPGKLNGELKGYMLEYSTPNMEQVSVTEPHSTTSASLRRD